ncbi:MAG: bifunctional hydroxymethylpyrimidine kinase/phosphomethylpyrimidine kinase [Acidobacteria bacterium]|nr:bifunctional hydroxymethylpyrimidine kinase/phosphomethylpyrimidine kinase [Acidobacteriota bacterium]
MHKHSKHDERLLRIIEAFPRIAVTVLGDMVADEFVFGEISRVSREAPVLILKHRERTIVPGGGANAVYNLADLGVTVLPVGVVGDDEAGKLLLQRFRAKKIAVSGILKLKGHTTVTKTRILAGHTHTARQQVVRIDREPGTSISAENARRLAIDAREYAPASDALLISDYGYGAAAPEILTAARAKRSVERLPITLDSRHRMLKFSGITAATPNEAEVEAALGTRFGDDTESLKAAGRTLLQRMKLDSLLITRGRHGMMSFAKGRNPVEIPIHGSDEVADVTGAGDTVIAAYTAALAAGADSESAARIANYAGGIVVMKRGTATVTHRELLDAVEHG